MGRETVIIFNAHKLKKAHGEGTGPNLIPDILNIKISSSKRKKKRNERLIEFLYSGTIFSIEHFLTILIESY
jgi:hypothetical protein